MSSSYTQVEHQQNVAPPALDAGGGEPQDVGAVVLKAKKAAASLWMILHAQVSNLRDDWNSFIAIYVSCSKSFYDSSFLIDTYLIFLRSQYPELPPWS